MPVTSAHERKYILMTPEQDAALASRAKEEGKTETEIIHAALAAFDAAYAAAPTLGKRGRKAKAHGK